MSSVDKSYIPQYIRYGPESGKTEGESGENAGESIKEVIVFPSIGSVKSGNNADKSYQDSIYPQLINSARSIDNATAKTPLLAKKKSIVPTKTNFFGIFLAFVSGVFFTLCSGTVKYLTEIDPMELLIFRSLFQIGVTLPIALYRGENLMGPPGSRMLLFAQGIVGGITLVLLFYSFRLLPLGDAATIIFSSPVFVMIMSHIWLREPCGFYRTFIVFFLVTGVVFITKPPFIFINPDIKHTYNILGYVAALFGTIFTAMNIVVMRKCKDVHFSVLVFQFSFWSLVISTLILVFGGNAAVPNQTPTQWFLVVLVAVFGLSGQILVAIALGYEGAGRVAVTRSMDIVLAYVLQVLIFNEVPDWKSVMGAGMVIVCVVGMGVEDVVHRLLNRVP